VGWGLRGNGSMPKQPKPNGTPSKKSPVRLVWLPLWLAAVLLAVMTRKAHGRPSPRQRHGSSRAVSRGHHKGVLLTMLRNGQSKRADVPEGPTAHL
jgi:hypothetical protein